ncbi:Pkinase-domain-containing protein [Testicularia cyperi]|uniref:Pkinase-domain-containing protein n=1 Tax=Testicularia cyperi TaxID=1882483 RepID=A0A317XW48_9BASI|nr:Pkinase-domain-containing protein [Testicularia cyperi]
MSAATPTSPGFPLAMGSGAMNGFAAGPTSSSGSPLGASRPTTPLSAGFSPAGPTYDDIRRWDDAEVANWLQSSRLGHHAGTFANNDIRGSVLLDVDQAALKEMGITSVGDRVRIFAAIKTLNKRCAEIAAARRPSVSSLPPLSPLGPHPIYSAAADGEIEYLEHDVHGDGSHDVHPGSNGLNSMGLRRGQMRPPPLTLQQSTSRGMPGHPGTLHNGQGFGLSAARGLTPGAARGSIRNTASSSANKPATADGSLHRKVNSIGGTAAPPISIASASPGPKPLSSGAGSSSGSRLNLSQGSLPGRPSTATGASGYTTFTSQSRSAGSSHSSNSPTGASFAANNGRPSTATGAQTYGSGMGAMSSTRDAYSPLTPISESNSYGATPTTPSALALQQQAAASTSSLSSSAGYSVGRGAFAPSQRSTPSNREWQQQQQQQQTQPTLRRMDSGEGYSTQYGYASPAPPTLEDLKRRTIKFISEEDNTTRIVNVSDCRDAYDVMARVLKKFLKPPSGNSYTPTAGQGPTGDDLGATETWGIFATSADGQNTKALSDNELLAICHAPQPHDPLRERGLTLRRIPNHLPGEDARKVPTRSGRHKLEAFFGERMPVAQMQPPGGLAPDEGDAGSVTISGKKVKRASTVSIMSGLGVGPFSSHHRSDNKQSASAAAQLISSSRKDPKHSPTSPTAPASKPSKIRNFFGQRPPSELINTNLADFFPSTEPKALQRTARRSVYGRASASTRSKRNSTWSFVADPDAPPLPVKESFESRRSNETQVRGSGSSTRTDRVAATAPAPVIHIGYDSSRSEDESSDAHKPVNGPPTLPPVVGRDSLDEWSRDLKAVGSPVAESGGPFPSNNRTHSYGSGFSNRPGMSRRTSGESTRSRRSLASQVRHGLSAARERNADAVSLLTVDEITQEVENRRESISLADAGGGWVVDEDGVPIPIPGGSSARSSSAAASTRPPSHLSSSAHGHHYMDDDDDEDDDSDNDDDRRPSSSEQRSSRPSNSGSSVPTKPSRAASILQAPGEESDRHLGDPMAVVRSTTSRASSVSELRRSIDNHADASDASSDSDEDYTDSDLDSESDMDEDDHDDGIKASNVEYDATAKNPPIKWHKGALIGAGSFGNVFLGMNAKTGLLMAVKQVELPSGDSHLDQRKKGMLEALEREIKLLKTLEHENIVQYLDSFADRTHLNIFLEYVPGGSIVALLRNYGAFEEPLVRNFVRQILKGLSFLHDRGIMHRDIKGANILVDNKGGIKISDFGISKKVESDLVLAAGAAPGSKSSAANRPSLQGSVFWMAPEVVKQTSYTIKADIWSLGCLVVEMISGTHPWAELNQMQALFQIGMGRKPSLPDEISNECKDFLEKTFELDHNRRPSADELLSHPFMGTQMTFGDGSSPNGNGGTGNGDNDQDGNLGAESSERDTTALADDQDEASGNSALPSTREGREGKEKRAHRSKSTRREKRNAASSKGDTSGKDQVSTTPGAEETQVPTSASAAVKEGGSTTLVPGNTGSGSANRSAAPSPNKDASADKKPNDESQGLPESVSMSSVLTARTGDD